MKSAGLIKLFACLMLQAASCLNAKSQSTDSLKTVLSVTQVNKPILEKYLQQLQTGDIVKIDELTLLGNWIIEHCSNDSLK